MYSEEESYIDCLSSESDSSLQCPNCFSKLNHQWKKVPSSVPSQKPVSVKEKIKYFSENSPASMSFKSLWSTESVPDTKILNKKNPLELDQKLYKSRTEICKTANGAVIKTYLEYEIPEDKNYFSGKTIKTILPKPSRVLNSFENKIV